MLEKQGNALAADAMMADNHYWLVTIKFINAIWNLAHGDMNNVIHGTGLHFPWLAYIQQRVTGPVFVQPLLVLSNR